MTQKLLTHNYFYNRSRVILSIPVKDRIRSFKMDSQDWTLIGKRTFTEIQSSIARVRRERPDYLISHGGIRSGHLLTLPSGYTNKTSNRSSN
jgi:hypothetical protein